MFMLMFKCFIGNIKSLCNISLVFNGYPKTNRLGTYQAGLRFYRITVHLHFFVLVIFMDTRNADLDNKGVRDLEGCCVTKMMCRVI